MSMGVVVSQIGMLFLMIAVGFIAGKTHVVKDEASGDITSLLMKVILPCTLFAANIRRYEASLMKDAMLALAISTVFFGASLLINNVIAKILKVKRGKAAIWSILSSFPNAGFVGFPVCQALYGDEGLFIASMVNLVFNIYVYTVGAIMVVKDSGADKKTSTVKMIFSNINIASVLGLFFLFLQIPFPCVYDILKNNAVSVLVKVINTIGAATTPLSMILIGLNMAKGKIREAVTDKDVLSSSLFRLVLAPLSALVCMWALFGKAGNGGLLEFTGIVDPGKNMLSHVVFPLVIAMPAPSVGVFLTEMYGGDKLFASRVAVLTSIACLVTIPFFAMLL